MGRKRAVSSTSSISTHADIRRAPKSSAPGQYDPGRGIPLVPVGCGQTERPANHIVVLPVELRLRQVRIRRQRRRTIQRVADGGRNQPQNKHQKTTKKKQKDHRKNTKKEERQCRRRIESVVDRAAADEPPLGTEAHPAHRERLRQIERQMWDGAQVLRTVLAGAINRSLATGVDEGVQRTVAEETRRRAAQQAKYIRERGLVVDVEVNSLGLLRGSIESSRVQRRGLARGDEREEDAELLVTQSAQVANRCRGQSGDRVFYLDVVVVHRGAEPQQWTVLGLQDESVGGRRGVLTREVGITLRHVLRNVHGDATNRRRVGQRRAGAVELEDLGSADIDGMRGAQAI